MSRSYRKPYMKDRSGKRHREFRRLVRSGERQDLKNQRYSGVINETILEELGDMEFRNRQEIVNDYDYNDYVVYVPQNKKLLRK